MMAPLDTEMPSDCLSWQGMYGTDGLSGVLGKIFRYASEGNLFPVLLRVNDPTQFEQVDET